MFQCRTQHCMWCNKDTGRTTDDLRIVSMPHAASYVVQHIMKSEAAVGYTFQCRTQHDMWCNHTGGYLQLVMAKFQCRTQHCMWCNTSMRLCVSARRGCFNAARSIICGATSTLSTMLSVPSMFQCRTQHCMWCNPLRPQ